MPLPRWLLAFRPPTALALGSLALALEVAPAARAAPAPTAPPTTASTAAPTEARRTSTDEPPKTSRLDGVIVSVDRAAGWVTVRPAGRALDLTLRARPFDLADLEAGDAVSLSTAEVGGRLWLMPRTRFDVDKTAALPGAVTLSGPITSIDASRGVVAVQGTELRVHPEQLRDLEPGQNVALSYTTIGVTPWVMALEPDGPVEVPSPKGRQDTEPVFHEERGWERLAGPRSGPDRGDDFVPGVDG